MNQKRQPKGTETGGQFAPDVNPESTVAKVSTEIHWPARQRAITALVFYRELARSVGPDYVALVP